RHGARSAAPARRNRRANSPVGPDRARFDRSRGASNQGRRRTVSDETTRAPHVTRNPPAFAAKTSQPSQTTGQQVAAGASGNRSVYRHQRRDPSAWRSGEEAFVYRESGADSRRDRNRQGRARSLAPRK